MEVLHNLTSFPLFLTDKISSIFFHFQYFFNIGFVFLTVGTLFNTANLDVPQDLTKGIFASLISGGSHICNISGFKTEQHNKVNICLSHII